MLRALDHTRLTLKRITLVAAAAALAACTLETPSTTLTQAPQLDLNKPVPVALLVPKSSNGAGTVAANLENAAKMAVADLGDIKIDLRVYDTAGSADVAAQQAQRAVDEGSKIILGPLFAEAANAAAVAVGDEGVNVMSFSNNPSIAGGNVFILGKTFDNTASRLMSYAKAQGKSRAVIVHPENVEGEFGRVALQRAANEVGIEVVSVQSFTFTPQGVIDAVNPIKNATLSGNADLLLLTSTSAGALPLLAQMLPEAGINPATIQYAGLSRWDIPPQTLALAGLQNGWFAMPDVTKTQNFSTRYQAAYGAQPHQLASLAYDGIAAIGALVAAGKANALTADALTQSSGFEGVDGIFRLNKNRTNERGLAIAQVKEQRVHIIDAAPSSFTFSGF